MRRHPPTREEMDFEAVASEIEAAILEFPQKRGELQQARFQPC